MTEKVAHSGGIGPTAAGRTLVVVLHEVVEIVLESDVDAMVSRGFKYLEALLKATGEDSLRAKNALGFIGVDCRSVVCQFEMCFVALFPIKRHVTAGNLTDPLSVEVMISLNMTLEVILASTSSLNAFFAAKATDELASRLVLLSHSTATHSPGR